MYFYKLIICKIELIKIARMIQRILVLLIFLSPLLMHAQDTKTTIKADTIKAIKQADNFGNGNKNYQSNDDSPKNLIKAFAFTLFSSESALGIVTLGYERKLSNSISCELVGSFSKVGSTSTTEVLAIRPAVKYYYTEDHKNLCKFIFKISKK